MTIFDPPYRWTRRPFANLYWCAWDVMHGIKRLWLWRDLVWNDHDFDWEPLAKMIVFKLRLMEPVMRNGHLEHGERHAREIAICRTILERIIADEYMADAGRFDPLPPSDSEQHRAAADRFRRVVKKADEQAKADLDLFGKMFARHLRSWWD